MKHVSRITYHVSKIRIRKLLRVSCFVLRDQSGVTLLLSVFILAGISLASLTVGLFALQEVRSSRAVFLTEPAISAAESGGEQGIWAIKRDTTLPGDCTDPITPEVLASSKTSITKCISYSNAAIDVDAGETVNFYLYDPSDPNGNLNPGYQYLTITHLSGFSATVTITRLADGSVISTHNILPNSDPTTAPLPTNPINDNRFKVTVTSNSGATLDMNTNLGIPDYPTIVTEGCSARSTSATACSEQQEAFKRKLQILVPK